MTISQCRLGCPTCADPAECSRLNLENGDRIVIEHPENIAFDPAVNGSRGSNDFYIISNQLRGFGTFEAVTRVALLDTGE